MAEELDPIRQEIDIVVNDKGAVEAASALQSITDEIQEQKDITIEFQKELVKLEKQLKDTPKNALADQKRLKDQIVQLKDAIKENGVAVKDLTNQKSKATAAEKESEKAVKASENGFKTLKVQLKEATINQQKLAAQFGATSDEAIAAAKAVAEIKDEIGIQKDLVDSYNPDDKFRDLTQTASLAAIALGGVKDGLSALGIESDFLDAIIGGAEGILGVTGAVGALSDGYAVLTASQTAASAAAVVATGTTEALAVAEVEATTATWSWNSALLANPIVAIAAAIVAAGVAIYAYVKITGDAVTAEEKAKMASMQLTAAINWQSESFERNNKFNVANNKHKADMLRASGASEAQIYRETKALADQELQLAKNYRAEATLAEQKAYEANRDNPTEFNAETLKNAQENLEKARQAVSTGYDGLIDLQNSHEVAMEQARTDARKKAAESAKKAGEDELARLKKLEDDKLALLMKSAKEALDIVNKIRDGLETPAEKEEREYQEMKTILEANNLSTEELEIYHIDRMFEIYKKEREDKQKLDDEYWAIEAEKAIKRTEDEVARDKKIKDAKKENQDAIISNSEALVQNVTKLAGKNKAIQKAAIIADGAVGVGKAVANTSEAVTKDLAKGFPFSAPLVALDVAVGATSVASIIKGTGDALKAVGGGGSVGGGAASALPTRNVAQVGFQGSSENQISSAITQSQKDQPPIQAFVVSQAVTDQQEIDRKKELNNSF